VSSPVCVRCVSGDCIAPYLTRTRSLCGVCAHCRGEKNARIQRTIIFNEYPLGGKLKLMKVKEHFHFQRLLINTLVLLFFKLQKSVDGSIVDLQRLNSA